MNKIIDFKCTHLDSVGIDKEVIQNGDFKFPETYKNWNDMAKLATAIKNHNKSPFCELPFCHTVEGEALGGIINYGDENIGPRAKKYICTTAEEILALPEIDCSCGRISEVLKACKYLRAQDENVVLNLSGPFTIMNVLMDSCYIYKLFKKRPEVMNAVLNKFQDEILRFTAKAIEAGVNMISYSDSAGGLNILGPKLSQQVVEMFTYPLFKRMEKLLNRETVVLLCPKTTFALLGTEKAIWEDINLSESLKYPEACIKVIGKSKFVGQTCIKNREFQLKNGIIKTIKLN